MYKRSFAVISAHSG